MESLPLLPGYIFSSSDPTSKDHKLKQKLKFLNGFRVIRDNYDADNFSCNDRFVDNPKVDASLTYGRPKRLNKYEHQRFLPHFVLFDHKCLRFEAYFKQGVFGSPDELYRVRRVNILYYLEDDTMAVIEPSVENAGFVQGKLVKRSKIPRPDKEDGFYHWKDLNVGMNIAIYGIIYRVVSCDAFTREFLTSQGIDVNEPEDLPPDPYLQNRSEREELAALANSYSERNRGLAADKRYRFLEYDGMILSFDAAWDGELFKVRYFLADDTISVCEVRRPNDGKDARSCLLLKRTKVPKNWKDLPATYPAVCMERSDEEVREYYSPSDLKVGETIFIFGRRFFLYDCDRFTRKYYADMLRTDQPDRIPIFNESENTCAPKSNESANCKSINESSRDLIRRLYNFPKKLRYSLEMDVVHPEDEGRKFVLEYNLSDGAIRINEIERRNSGRAAGCFLGWIRVPKQSDSNEYYSPEDFYIGGRLNIFGHWFVITGTEPFVYKYMRANPHKFNEKLRENIEEYLKSQGLIEEDDYDTKKNEIDRTIDANIDNHMDNASNIDKKELTSMNDC